MIPLILAALPQAAHPHRAGLPVAVLIVAILLSLVATTAWPSSDAQGCSDALGRPIQSDIPGISDPIRLLSWNIQKSGSLGWEMDLQNYGSDRDLLLIQEASAQFPVNGSLPQPLYRAFAAGYTTDDNATGVLTLSETEPSLQCNLTAWEPWLGTPKATNITEYPLLDSPLRLLVINLHAVNFTVGTSEFIAQIEALVPLIERHIGPLLIAGDFNTWSVTRQTLLDEFMAKYQLLAVEFEPDVRTTFWSMPVDHVFLRGLKPVLAQAVKVDTSDHNPLLVTLEILQ